MAWDKALTYKHGDENVRQRHLLNVYADPEFKAEIELLIGKDGGSLMTAHFDELAARYCITEDEIMHHVSGLTAALPTPKDKPFFINLDEYDDKDYFTVTFDADIKEKDFREVWKLISRKQKRRHGGKQTRNRPYDDDRLVYAIFKELQKSPKPKLPAIFEKYQKGELDYYKDGTTNWVSSAKDLREYYNDYKPSNQPPARPAAAKRFEQLRDQSIRKYIKKQKPKSDKK